MKGMLTIERQRGSISMLGRKRLLIGQNSKCAICGIATELVLDHDHNTGKIRGFLCRSCNAKLGYVDNKKSVISDNSLYNLILDYLQYPPINKIKEILCIANLKEIAYNSPSVFRSVVDAEKIKNSPDYITVNEFLEIASESLHVPYKPIEGLMK